MHLFLTESPGPRVTDGVNTDPSAVPKKFFKNSLNLIANQIMSGEFLQTNEKYNILKRNFQKRKIFSFVYFYSICEIRNIHKK